MNMHSQCAARLARCVEQIVLYLLLLCPSQSVSRTLRNRMDFKTARPAAVRSRGPVEDKSVPGGWQELSVANVGLKRVAIGRALLGYQKRQYDWIERESQ